MHSWSKDSPTPQELRIRLNLMNKLIGKEEEK